MTALPSQADEWYEAGQSSETPLMQADVLLGYPLTIAQYENPEDALDGLRTETAVILLTQSCDIPKGAQQTLLVGIVLPYPEAIIRYQDLRSKEAITALREGNSIGFCLLPPSASSDWSVVCFRETHTVPKVAVQNFAARSTSTLLRLRSPYREHVSQSYARFLMRVGLPLTYHSFEDYAKEIRRSIA